MDMKYPLILLALLCLSVNLSGQLRLGGKAFIGQSLTKSHSKDYADVYAKKIYKYAYENSAPRKRIGASLYGENKLLFFMTDALYSTSGRQFSLLSTNYQATPLDPAINMSTEEKNLRLVVNGGLKFGDLKLGVGPEISLLLESEEDFSMMDDIEKTEASYTSGFNFLVGYVLNKHLHLDLRYTYIFQDVSSEYTFQGLPMDLRKNAKYLEVTIASYF